MIALSLVAAACGRSPDAVGSGRSIDIGDLYSSGIAWPSGNRIILASDLDAPPGTELLSIELQGAEVTPFLNPRSDSCENLWYLQPDLLPDGRLAFISDCNDQGGKSELLAYDASNDRIEVLASVASPLAGFTWDPLSGRGLVVQSDELCSGFTLVTNEGVQELPVTVGEGGSRMRIDEGFFLDPTEGCASQGLADWPVWSPDGSKIAFFASPQSVGVGGFAKPMSPWNLYIMDSGDMVPAVVVEDVRFPRSPQWSAGSDWLAFAGELTGSGEGVWLLHLASGRLSRVVDETVDWLTWGPDGRKIATLQSPVDQSALKHELRIYRVDDLLTSES